MSYSKGGHSLFRHVLYKGTTKGWWDMKYKAGAVGAEVASRLGPVIEKENAANRALNEKFQLENILKNRLLLYMLPSYPPFSAKFFVQIAK